MKIMFMSSPYDLVKSGYGSSSKVNYGNLPPLGALYLIGELRRHDHECDLLDLGTFSMSYEEVARKIREFGAELLAISTMTPSAPAAYELAEYLKEELGLPIILGGVHCTSFKEKVLDDCPAIDAIGIGEAETTIAELVSVFEGKMEFSEVMGIGYRDDNGEAICTGSRPLVMDLDTLAFPARDLLDHTAYSMVPLSFKRLPMTSMITSRGCPYGHCTFCFEAGNSAFKFRRNSVDYTMREIEETILPHGIKEIGFWDDIFLINKKWVKEFCDRIPESKLIWSCYAWPKATTREMLAQAAEAGCWSVFYGFESGDQKLLDTLEKRITLDDSRNAAKWAHEAGLQTRGSFMLALPGETPELAKKTVNFAIELDCTLAQFLPTFPEMGTELYNMALMEGKVVEYDGHMKPHYVPDGYSGPEEIEKMLRYAHLRFYMRPRVWWKHIRQIRSWLDLVHYIDAARFFIGMFGKRIEPEPLRCSPAKAAADKHLASKDMAA